MSSSSSASAYNEQNFSRMIDKQQYPALKDDFVRHIRSKFQNVQLILVLLLLHKLRILQNPQLRRRVSPVHLLLTLLVAVRIRDKRRTMGKLHQLSLIPTKPLVLKAPTQGVVNLTIRRKETKRERINSKVMVKGGNNLFKEIKPTFCKQCKLH